MAWESQGLDVSAPVNRALAEESARAFMGRVYRWMFGGLLLTGVVAWVTATSPALLSAVASMFMPIVIGKLVLVMAFSWLAPRVSGPVAAVLFLTYCLTTGLVFSLLFLAYQLGSIAQAFFITAGAFGAMSAYGTLTKKDLSAWGTFLFMGLIGVVIASIVQLFARSDALSFVISCASVVVFAGLTAYDTQKLRQYHASSGFSSAMTLSIHGALMLYLDFVNLFLALLRLFGRRR